MQSVHVNTLPEFGVSTDPVKKERFNTWGDFVQGRQETTMPEFGSSVDPVRDIAKWLGGAAEAPNNYANIVKYGVGSPTLSRFTGLAETTIKSL